MNKKRMRGIIICALVLLMAFVAVLNVDIEPADHTDNTSPVLQTKETKISVADKKENEKAEKTENTDLENTVLNEVPALEEEPVPIPERHICTIEIRCDTVADTSKLENPAVAPYVPADGVILETTEIEFTPGESVFDILLRATKEKNIHLEFRGDGAYGGKYIEGINYLYEMDAGPVSGWMYKVSGKFPNYGCANYKVNDRDAIVWMYTCDLGLDVGDNSVW